MLHVDEKNHDLEAASDHDTLPDLVAGERESERSKESNDDQDSLQTPCVANQNIYDRFSPQHKAVITTVLAVCAFLSPMGSTMILSATPEVASQYKSTGTVINISNALYMVSMGLSPCLWGPLSSFYGRRWICVTTAILFFAFSLGNALAPNLPAYFVFRILTAFQGTSFLVVGSSCLSDIYTPTERATAVGWFMLGFQLGPVLGPFFGGIIVTYQSWRCIFYLQAGLGGLGVFLTLFFLPETNPEPKKHSLHHLSRLAYARQLMKEINPLRVIGLFRYPNLLCTGLASSSLLWNMYSLLTPIRYVLNPRFNLTSPIQSAFFYLAPGVGYLLGTFLGGRWADHVVKRYIQKRHGERVPEDRLRSCLPFFCVVLPASMLLYGWSVDKRFGGIPLPMIAMFTQGLAQLFAFPSINTYSLDVMQESGRSAEVVAGNYVIRYMFAAAGSASCLPAIDTIGVGWFSTVSATFLFVCALLTWATATRGRGWRNRIDRVESR